jgi:hypothetical protein
MGDRSPNGDPRRFSGAGIAAVAAAHVSSHGESKHPVVGETVAFAVGTATRSGMRLSWCGLDPVHEILEHSTVTMTMRYAHANPQAMQAAVKVLARMGTI